MRYLVDITSSGNMVEKTFDTKDELDEFFHRNVNSDTEFTYTRRQDELDGRETSSIPVVSGI